MNEPPKITILSGSPTPRQEEAIRRAILQLWGEERAKATRAARMDPWVAAARAEATGRTVDLPWATGVSGVWRLSNRLGDNGVRPKQTGRGDSK